MRTFITQGGFTREAINGLVEPRGRADAVGRLLSKAGGRCSGII